MKTRILLFLAGAALLHGCATKQSAPLPDGRSRVQVNSRANIDAYLAQLAGGGRAANSETSTERQMEALRNDVAYIKSQLAALQSRPISAERTVDVRRSRAIRSPVGAKPGPMAHNAGDKSQATSTKQTPANAVSRGDKP